MVVSDQVQLESHFIMSGAYTLKHSPLFALSVWLFAGKQESSRIGTVQERAFFADHQV